MYRIEVQSTASAPFASLAEAQQAHVALAGQAERFSVAEKVDAASARAAMVAIAQLRREIRAFEWRLAATGTVIADAQQRSLAQSLLDFWALRHVELRERAWQYGQIISERSRPQVRRPVSPRTLLPVDEGLAETLAETAERVYLELPDDDARSRARKMFLAIANPYSGERTINLDVAAKFAAKGVIVGGGNGSRYALAHDSLAMQWPRLVGWLQQARREETEYELVAANARNWSEHQGDDSLPLGAALDQARKYVDRDPEIATYVDRADAARQRQLENWRKIKLAAWFAIPLVIVIAAIAAIAGFLRGRDEITSDPSFKVQLENTHAEESKYAEGQQAIPVMDNSAGTGKAAISVAAPVACAEAKNAHGFIWLGSRGNSQVLNIKGKPVEPDVVSDGMPLLIGVWLNLRQSMPVGSGDNRAGPTIGTASARSSAITTAAPKFVNVNGIDQYWVEVDLLSSVFIQVPEGGSARVERLRQSLDQVGLKVPAIQQLPMPGGLNEVRYYYEQDAARAEQVACLANLALEPDSIDKVKVRSLVGTALAAKVNNGTIELWLYPQQVLDALAKGRR